MASITTTRGGLLTNHLILLSTGVHDSHDSHDSPSPVSNILPENTVSSDAVAPSDRLTAINREAAIALAVLMLLILVAIIWYTRSRMQRHRRDSRARSTDAEMAVRPASRAGILQRRVFRVREKDSRKHEAWVGAGGGMGERRATSSTLGEAEDWDARRARSRDRTLWEAVAGHGLVATGDVEAHVPSLVPAPSRQSAVAGGRHQQFARESRLSSMADEGEEYKDLTELSGIGKK